MNKKNVTNIVPLFLAIYFLIAFVPIITKQKTEIFPFFSFKLYSKIPNEVVKYDIIFDKGKLSEHFLIYKNLGLNKLEKKNFNYRLNKLGQQYEETGNFSFDQNLDLLLEGETAFFVKISGNPINAVLNNEYDINVIGKIK